MSVTSVEVPELEILVVDDDEGIRESISLALRLEGYRVCTATNGQEALDVLDGALPPKLILLDMVMPIMDGWGFAKAYRLRQGPRAPVVVFTAAWNAAIRAAEIGADEYIAKPIDLADLVELVGRYVPRVT
ncbi:MAG: hypothetical protein QOF51_3936 [Chloroflexota bacterium]|jgi:CheY-like chemotaxis protein|nr:hypothetical protein [Chloroflexota bacterium]